MTTHTIPYTMLTPTMRRFRAFLLTNQRSRVSTTLVLLLPILAACGDSNAPPESATDTAERVVALMPADVAIARLDTIAGGVLVSGALEPMRRVVLTAQVDGTVASLLVDRGSRVRRGQLLLTITADGVREQAAGSDASIAAAKAGIAVAEHRRDGARSLYEAGAIAEVELRAAEAQYAAAVAELKAAEAGAAGAREMASRTRVTAPIDGAISDRQVQAGEPVSNGNPMVTVVDTRTLELAGRVGVDIASRLSPGMSVELTLGATPGETYRGVIARIDPEADAGTRQVGVYVQLPNRDGALIAGQYATGRVLLDAPRALVVVPSMAVRVQNGESTVSVVADGRVRVQKVEVAVRDEARAIVGLASGLEAGARVLAMPGAELEDGTAVRVITPATPNDRDRSAITPAEDTR